MAKIKIEKNLSEEQLDRRGVFDWDLWEKEISEFPWTYDDEETCYVLDGEVEVIPDDGEAVLVVAGDFVTFPQGMNCYWKIHSPIRKYYQFN